jgi:hypothetical protein
MKYHQIVYDVPEIGWRIANSKVENNELIIDVWGVGTFKFKLDDERCKQQLISELTK